MSDFAPPYAFYHFVPIFHFLRPFWFPIYRIYTLSHLHFAQLQCCRFIFTVYRFLPYRRIRRFAIFLYFRFCGPTCFTTYYQYYHFKQLYRPLRPCRFSVLPLYPYRVYIFQFYHFSALTGFTILPTLPMLRPDRIYQFRHFTNVPSYRTYTFSHFTIIPNYATLTVLSFPTDFALFGNFTISGAPADVRGCPRNLTGDEGRNNSPAPPYFLPFMAFPAP